MSDFGVLLSTDGGQPFVTPISTPMALYGKYEVTSAPSGNGRAANLTIPWNNAWPAMVFVKCNINGVTLGTVKGNGSISASGYTFLNNNFVMTVYVFGIFPQPAPAFGIAIWNSAGDLVLTNETKVLSDLITIGNPAIASQSGIGMDITLTGSYAVCPQIHGTTLYQISAGAGQPVIVNVMTYTCANNSGGVTRFTAAANQAPGGNPAGYTDTRCILTGINTSAYD